LLAQQGGQGALGQALGGRGGDLLQGHKVDVGARASLAENASGDDFSPPGGQIMDLLQFLRRDDALRHGQSCLVLA
jgi:hypothetical protein